MKKSEMYLLAACAVLESKRIPEVQKLEIVARMMADKNIAEICERYEEEQA